MSKTATATRKPAGIPRCFTCPYHEPGKASAAFAGEAGIRPGLAMYEAGVYRGVYGEGLCKRHPVAEPKGPDDWCGEHPGFAAHVRA